MIQKHINLFANPLKKSKRGVEYLRKIRIVALILSFFSFLALLVVFVVQATLTSNMSQVEKEKSFVEEEINQQLERQISNHLVGMRIQTIEAANKKDISYASKEATLRRILTESDVDAEITSLSIPNLTDFTAKLLFPSKNELLNFVRVSETQEFSDKFALVRISNFSVSDEASPSGELEDRTMTIIGQFL
ncbi:MAG: hypothetical protein U0525_02400 [Patescibacteria group bacterium]